jgi:hypothetical protein
MILTQMSETNISAAGRDQPRPDQVHRNPSLCHFLYESVRAPSSCRRRQMISAKKLLIARRPNQRPRTQGRAFGLGAGLAPIWGSTPISSPDLVFGSSTTPRKTVQTSSTISAMLCVNAVHPATSRLTSSQTLRKGLNALALPCLTLLSTLISPSTSG